MLEHVGGHVAVHRLDERRVLAADLVVEREELGQPGLVGSRQEEVVQVALAAVRAVRRDRADGEVGGAGEDVEIGVRVEEVELAPNVPRTFRSQMTSGSVWLISTREYSPRW